MRTVHMNATVVWQWLGAGWDGVRRLLRHAAPIRVPLLIVLGAILLTRKVDQIHELFSVSVAAADGGHFAKELSCMVAASIVLAGCVWYSARTVLRFDVVRTHAGFAHANPLFRAWTPRGLALAITVIVAFGFINAHGEPGTRALCALAVVGAGAFVFVFTWLRRNVYRRFRDDIVPVEGEVHRIERWPRPTRVFAAVSVGVFVLVNALAWIYPAATAAVAGRLGPLATLMLLAALFIAATTPLVLWSRRWDVPAFTLLLVWATAWQMSGAIDNHKIQLVPGQPTSSIEHAFDTWASTTTCDRAYFVSAEGGGIRAAAWTALVLAKINRILLASGHRLSDCLVAASGVSGGSLGVAAFVAGQYVLDTPGLTPAKSSADCTHEMPNAPQGAELECRLVYMLTRDFISPTLAAMFTSDQLQRLLPRVELPDRGRALENAFADAFADAFGLQVDDALTNPFSPGFAFSRLYASPSTMRAHPWVPVLVLNSTEVRSGHRVLQSGVILQDSEFPGARGLDAWLHNQQPTLLGAVHNSARFTYISPAGSLPARNGRVRQLVDGGYFENSGATTLADLARIFEHVSADQWKGRIAFIHISNDPDLGRARDDAQDPLDAIHTGNAGIPPDTQVPAKPALGEVAPPLVALFETRESRAAYARKMLERSATGEPDRYDYAHLGLNHVKYPLPLGWRIGDLAICELIAQFDGDLNRNELAKVIGPLPPPPAKPARKCARRNPSTFVH
jgi:hypothetical protein